MSNDYVKINSELNSLFDVYNNYFDSYLDYHADYPHYPPKDDSMDFFDTDEVFKKIKINNENIESETCIFDKISEIKYYQKDKSFTNDIKLVNDITYSDLYPSINMLFFILEVEKQILFELHNYEDKYSSIGSDIYGHKFYIKCNYVITNDSTKVVDNDLGYYEVQLEFKNNKNFIKIVGYEDEEDDEDDELTAQPVNIDIDKNRFESVKKILNILNDNIVSKKYTYKASENTYSIVSLNDIREKINEGKVILSLFQYFRVDLLILILHDIVVKNIYSYIKKGNTVCSFSDNGNYLNHFEFFYNRRMKMIDNIGAEMERSFKLLYKYIDKGKTSGILWMREKEREGEGEEQIIDETKYSELYNYLKENFEKKYSIDDIIPENISLNLYQYEKLVEISKNYTDDKNEFIKIDKSGTSYYYKLALDNITISVYDHSEIDEKYKTEQVIKKTNRLNKINSDIEKKNRLLKTINSNVELEKKKLDKINVVYIFTICLFILLSIILILLGSDKIDYKKSKNFINILIFLTFIIFLGLHYYIGKIKETQKEVIKLDNIFDNEIFKVKNTLEKFADGDFGTIKSKIENDKKNAYLTIIYIGVLHKKNEDGVAFVDYLGENAWKLNKTSKSYYNIIHPLLEKEIHDYTKQNDNTRMYKNIADFNLNISRRDTKFSIETINYLLNLSLLLAIILLIIFYNSNYMTIVGVITIIIFIIISLIYFSRIIRIVRTNHKKKYWQKPLESNLKQI